jgi:hypothetical protein
VPRESIRVARGAEDDFARAAQADLERLERFHKLWPDGTGAE